MTAYNDVTPGTGSSCRICGDPITLHGFGDKTGPHHDRWVHDDGRWHDHEAAPR